MKASAIIISCAVRRESRRATINSFLESDWRDDAAGASKPQPVSVVEDDEKGRTTLERIILTTKRALERAAESTDDLVLICEDDIAVNRHLRANLESWGLMGKAFWTLQHFCGSLYTPAAVDLTCPIVARPLERIPDNKRVILANPFDVWGAQCLCMTPATAGYVLRNWNEVIANADERIPRIAGRITPFFYHCPSLVQHVGTVSTWSAKSPRFHQAPDFDPDWKAAP